jgi:ribosomal protein S7
MFLMKKSVVKIIINKIMMDGTKRTRAKRSDVPKPQLNKVSIIL